jgi:hypothetical protein
MEWNSLFTSENAIKYTKNVINYSNINKSVVFKFLLKKYITTPNEKNTIYENIKNYFKENELLKKIYFEEKDNKYLLVYKYFDERFDFARHIYITVDKTFNSNLNIKWNDIVFLFYINKDYPDTNRI